MLSLFSNRSKVVTFRLLDYIKKGADEAPSFFMYNE